jgi:hypothetical protein
VWPPSTEAAWRCGARIEVPVQHPPPDVVARRAIQVIARRAIQKEETDA